MQGWSTNKIWRMVNRCYDMACFRVAMVVIFILSVQQCINYLILNLSWRNYCSMHTSQTTFPGKGITELSTYLVLSVLGLGLYGCTFWTKSASFDSSNQVKYLFCMNYFQLDNIPWSIYSLIVLRKTQLIIIWRQVLSLRKFIWSFQ